MSVLSDNIEDKSRGSNAAIKYTEETFSYFRKTVILKIENTILFDRDVTGSDIFDDFLFLMRSSRLENKEAFIKLLKTLLETSSQLRDHFFRNFDEALFREIMACFKNVRSEPKTFVMLLRKVREINFDFLNTHRVEIEAIHTSLKSPNSTPYAQKIGNKEELKKAEIGEKSSETPKIGDKKQKNSQKSPETPKKRDSSALYEISKKLTETHRELEIMTERCDQKEEESAGLKIQLQSVVTEKKLLEGMKRELTIKLKGMDEKFKGDAEQKKRARNEANIEFSNLTAKVELLETENQRMREKEKILQSQNSNECKIRTAIESQYETLKSEREATQSDLRRFRDQSARLERSFAALQRMAEAQLGQAGELYKKQFLELKRAQKAAAESERRESGAVLKFNDCREELKGQKNLKDQFQKRSEAMEEEIQLSGKERKEMMGTLMATKKRNDELEAEITSITQIKSQFMNQLLEKQELIARLQDNMRNNDESNDEMREMKKHLEALTRENHELKSRMFDDNEMYKKMEEENKELIVYLDKLLKEREKP